MVNLSAIITDDEDDDSTIIQCLFPFNGHSQAVEEVISC